MKDIEVEVTKAGPANDMVLLQVKGVIDTTTSRYFAKTLSDLLADRNYKIVVNLEKVSYISSAGWGIFIGEIRNIQNNRGDLKLAALIPEVEEVYKLLEFFNIIKAYDSVEEALADFK